MNLKVILLPALLLIAFVAALAQEASVIREIVVQGNQRVSREAILAAMVTRVGQPYLQENLDRDRQTIDGLGFFQSVNLRAVPVEGGNWRIIVEIVEQPEIKEIRVTGNTVVSTEEILNVLLLKPGDVFNLASLRPSAEAIRQLYTRKGYFVDVEEFAPMPDSPNTVNLSLIETTVNSVAVQGNARTRNSVMRRLIKTRPGEPLSITKWSGDLRRIYNTQWFESVRSIEEQVEQGRVNLTADVKEMRTGMFNVGLQIDPRSSLAGLLRLSDANFQGTGQSVGINLLQSTGGGGTSIDLDYANPFIDHRDTSFRASIYSRVLFRFAGTLFGGGIVTPTADDRYLERRTGLSFGFGRPLRENVTTSIGLRAEDVRTEDLVIRRDGAGNIIPYLQQDGTVGVLTLAGTLNQRDTDIDPSRGSWMRAEIEPGFARIREAGPVGMRVGSSGFLRSMLEYRAYFTDQPPRGRQLDAPRRVLAVRARYGTIVGTVPFFEQFFAGGADTVRGYSEDRFWGKQTLLTTVEYRYPLQRAFNVVAFVDYGGAWGGFGDVNQFTQDSRFRLHVGYGLGLSFRTPLGPIRLDFGFDESGKSRTHFLIGTSF